MHDAAVRADGNVDARLLEIFVARAADIDDRCRLTATDALRLARDADRAAADADLDEVCARIREEAEAFAVNDIARTDLDILAEFLVDVFKRLLLPLRIALGGVDAKDVRARLKERRHALGIVARVDARADDVALALVDQLKLVFLVVRVVLAEHHVAQALVLVNERQHVELMLPDEIVRLRQREIRIRVNEALERRHEILDGRVEAHARHAVVAARDDADELAVRCAVLRDRHRRMSRRVLERQDLAERRRRLDVRIAAHEARLVVLDARDHRRFLLGRLRTVDEGHAALARQGDRHRVV